MDPDLEVVPSHAHKGEWVVVRKGVTPGRRVIDGILMDTNVVAAGRWASKQDAQRWLDSYAAALKGGAA